MNPVARVSDSTQRRRQTSLSFCKYVKCYHFTCFSNTFNGVDPLFFRKDGFIEKISKIDVRAEGIQDATHL